MAATEFVSSSKQRQATTSTRPSYNGDLTTCPSRVVSSYHLLSTFEFPSLPFMPMYRIETEEITPQTTAMQLLTGHHKPAKCSYESFIWAHTI